VRKEKPVLHYIGLQDAYAHLYRTPRSNVWNYQFIIDAFANNNKKDTAASSFDFDLKKVELGNVRFHMDDAWVGYDMDYGVGSLTMNVKDIDFKKELIDVDDIDIKAALVSLKAYKGGRPADTNKSIQVYPIDSTPFNPDKWLVLANSLSIKNSYFNLSLDDRIPLAGQFDAEHLQIKDIGLDANHISIRGDTIRGTITNLKAIDRCGLAIKKMKAKVTVSPVESTCDNLYLETNNSKVQNYYSMRYKRFPDFDDYITNVKMVGHLKDAVIDNRDLVFFAPQLQGFPIETVHVSGDGEGTVADLSGRHMIVTDGKNFFKGNISMKGLPDIYKTYIDFNEGELITTGPDLIKYIPSLVSIPDFGFNNISSIYFKGDYNGYIENFQVNGIFNTNLGSLSAQVQMNMKDFNMNAATYSGTISSDNFNVGALLKQTDLGIVSFKSDINGRSFNGENAQLGIDAQIGRLDLHNYSYRNIIAKGTLAKKQFTGKLQVDDPNLALEFDGNIDFSQQMMHINAKANLLKSNFYALKLTKDTIMAVGDFDLNCTGSNIDDFAGYAKLNNINIKRNQHRLDLDSIYITSKRYESNKLISIQSNDITATIKGNFQLSKLPASVQYYLSRYIPNYINAPSKYAPDQDMSFTISTKSVTNIIGVIAPAFKGFDNATVSGSLNTAQKKVLLKASIPEGSIGNVHFSNVSISGDGNYDLLELNTSIDNVSIGDSVLNGSLSVTATLGNDSLQFNIATSSPDANSSAVLNGHAFAHKDSLFLDMLPSQFYLNQAKWDIPGGSHIVYSDKYLFVKDLVLKSGLQKITANTVYQANDQQFAVNIQELDLGQLGNWAGLAAYQPDGRLNGTVNIQHLFSTFYVSSNIKATSVLLGADTIGNINIIGTYDGSKKLVNLDPQTGIYRGNSSVNVSGNMSFDSTTAQQINGKISFNNAPANWFSSFLIGFISHIKGTLQGDINIKGRSYDPSINGDITLNDANMHIDFLGANYSIPKASIHVDEEKIDVGTVSIYDSYKNKATLTGQFLHKHFKYVEMRLAVRSDKFEIFNLHDYENQFFYGNLIAKVDPVTIRGPFNNISIDIANAVPVAKSSIYIPISSSKDVGTYSYVSFKTYGKPLPKTKAQSKNKLAITIEASLNPLAEMTLVIDPSTGDAIRAKGNGDIRLEIPPSNDIRMYGSYNIDEGDYSITFKQLLSMKRKFILNADSKIDFNGPFAQTNLDINATYTTHTRLYDILSDAEKTQLSSAEASDARLPQDVNVLLYMKGSLNNQKLSFKIQLPETRSFGTTAYYKLDRVNQDDAQLLDQVASLLIIGDFISTEGIGGNTATTGAINNFSQILSNSASTQLTNIVNKITHNKDLAIDLKYSMYNLGDPSQAAVNRNQFSLGLRKPYFHDRLIVEVGGKSDWGRPTSTSSASSFNIAGDFRAQYLLNASGGLRFNVFRTSDYDVTLDRDITRSGTGLSWRKSFDGFSDFFHGKNYDEKQLKKEQEKKTATKIDSTK